MKLKITQKGFENYTGQMGMILFKNGVSVYDVKERDALRLSACFGCKWENDSAITVTKLEEEPRAPIGRQTYIVESDGAPEKVAGNDGRTIYVDVGFENEPIKVTRRFTLQELEAIADKKGIKGIREVAAPLGIRGTSINAMIEDILAVAGQKEDLPEGVEVVGE